MRKDVKIKTRGKGYPAPGWVHSLKNPTDSGGPICEACSGCDCDTKSFESEQHSDDPDFCRGLNEFYTGEEEVLCPACYVKEELP